MFKDGVRDGSLPLLYPLWGGEMVYEIDFLLAVLSGTWTNVQIMDRVRLKAYGRRIGDLDEGCWIRSIRKILSLNRD